MVHSFGRPNGKIIDMENTVNVRKEMNALKVGEAADFPIERYDYVLSCRTRLQTISGVKRFSSSTEKAGFVTITRLEDKTAEETA